MRTCLFFVLLTALAPAALLLPGCAQPRSGDPRAAAPPPAAPAETQPDVSAPPAPATRVGSGDGGTAEEQPAPRPLSPGPSGGVLIPEQAAYDVDHYRLDLEVHPETRRIDGRLTMTATMLEEAEEIALDLDHHLTVESVRSHSPIESWEHRDRRIWIRMHTPLQPDETLMVVVDYGGEPRVAPRPPWDGGFTWAETPSGQPWIATTCQGEGADLWWPCKDHPSDKPRAMNLRITVPDGLFCASNGTLHATTINGDGTTTFDWRVASPISNYNVALNIAPYEVLEQEYTSVDGTVFPFMFWVLPEHREQGAAILPQFVDHMQFFEETLGPYPFRSEKYGVVETPHLGMEHQTIIAYGNQFRPSDWPDYDWLHHHELSHEWWANLVTAADWKDMWIHEGFGTYMQALYLESRHGQQAYRQEMATKRRRISNQQPVAPREVHDTKQIYFGPDGGSNNDIYSKGSWVLHTLRWTVGDDAFFAGLRRCAYPDAAHRRAQDGSQVRLVDTDDIIAIFEQEAGRDLGDFFEVYVRQPALPRLVAEREGEELRLRWETPDDLPFDVPVPVQVGDTLHRVAMDGGAGSIVIPPDAEVTVDPEAWLLKE